MELVNDFRNELLKRRELDFTVTAESNPGLEYGKKLISDKFKVDTDKIVVNNVFGEFGSNSFSINAYIYDTVEGKIFIEPRIKKKKEEKK